MEILYNKKNWKLLLKEWLPLNESFCQKSLK